MSITITPSGQACGAQITGVDLREELGAGIIATIRTAWLDHCVLSFLPRPNYE
jgi:taurine dioxygenase